MTPEIVYMYFYFQNYFRIKFAKKLLGIQDKSSDVEAKECFNKIISVQQMLKAFPINRAYSYWISGTLPGFSILSPICKSPGNRPGF